MVTEDQIQIQIVGELRYAGRAVFWHTPNSGKVSKRAASRRKSMGVLAGVPDLIFLHSPMRAIELKTDRGRLSDSQKELLPLLRSYGWEVEVCHGLEEARMVCRDWGYL